MSFYELKIHDKKINSTACLFAETRKKTNYVKPGMHEIFFRKYIFLYVETTNSKICRKYNSISEGERWDMVFYYNNKMNPVFPVSK